MNGQKQQKTAIFTLFLLPYNSIESFVYQQFCIFFVYIIMYKQMKIKKLIVLMTIVSVSYSTRGQSDHKTLKEENAMYKVQKSENEWKNELSPDEYKILRQCGTEAPGTGKYYDFFEKGTYLCAACGYELFDSKTKYSSGSGWPSFYDIISDSSVVLIEDNSHGMMRTEVRCSNCGGHLGHVFPDGPAPTNLRYCINSIALKFEHGEGIDTENNK